MKKYMLMTGMVFAMLGTFAQTPTTKKVKQEEKKEVYQCPMKCEGTKTYSKKGKCPACTMDLKVVKK
ncbi:MAG: hypothetical protein RJA04_1370 [Bacteroidota bacterium]